MSKSLTLSMSLALALGFSGVSFAGHGTAGCDTCGLASPQGAVASPQGVTETCDTCAPAKKHHSFKMSWPACLKPKPKMYTYEWVLKKKRVHGHHAAEATCDTCGTAVTPSGQYSSPQATAAPQTWAAPQATYGASQASVYPTTEMKPAMPAPTGDAVPPAPVAPPAPAAPAPPAPSASNSLLFLAPAGN